MIPSNIPITKFESNKKIFQIPQITSPPQKKHEKDIIYPIEKGVVYIGLHFNSDIENYMYYIYEPPVSPYIASIIRAFPEYITIHYKGGEINSKLIMQYLDKFIEFNNFIVNRKAYYTILYYIERNMFHYGEITPILNDDLVEDISLTGVNKPIYVYHRYTGSIPTSLMFKSEEEANHFIFRLAEKAHRTVSYREPLLDAFLPEGHRLNLSLGNEVTAFGPTFTIRRFKMSPLTIFDLVNSGMVSYELLSYLWLQIENHRNVMIIGTTAAGKTTMLNNLLTFIKDVNKLVTIEDTHELYIDHDNWVATITRPGVGIKGSSGIEMGEVDIMTLLKVSLRQRPEYLVVGESRGEETQILFQAMATGHTGLATFHATDIQSFVSRIENAPISLPRSMLTLLSDIVIMQAYVEKMVEKRRVKEIAEIAGYDQTKNQLQFVSAFRYDPVTDSFITDTSAPGYKAIATLHHISTMDVYREVRRRAEFLSTLEKLYKGKISNKELHKFVQVYHLLKDVEVVEFPIYLKRYETYIKEGKV